MNQSTTLLFVNMGCDEAVSKFVERAHLKGWWVMRSFNLQAARAAHLECTCPHHGIARCDCQMIVLLIYMNTDRPLTMIAHGRASITQFVLVDMPKAGIKQRAEIEMVLRSASVEKPYITRHEQSIRASEIRKDLSK